MFVGRNLLCKVTDFGFFSNNCHFCVEIFILDIRIQKWQLLFDSTKTFIFFWIFSYYEKRLHSPFLPLHRQNKEVWVSGLNQHTANVPNRKVPKVRNRLKREQKPSLLGLCRVSSDSQRNPSGVYMEFVAQLVECQVVALVVVGSIPIKLPNASIAQW